MIVLVLSYFHPRIGPKIYMNYPIIPDHLQLDHIPFLMDFYQEGFFVHEFGELKTANRIFTIDNPKARGKEDTLMISVLMLDEHFEPSSFRDILEIFIDRFSSISNVYKGLNPSLEEDPDSIQKMQEIDIFLQSFFQSLPRERTSIKLRITKIFIYGLPGAGISTLVNHLQSDIFNERILREEINISKTLLGNLSLVTFNFFNRNIIDEILSVYLKKIDAIVFVLDGSDTEKYPEACKELHQISQYEGIEHLPLLILINKIDLGNIDTDELVKAMKFDILKNKRKKIYHISALNSYGITDAFKWLTNEISNQILKDPLKYFA